MCGPGPAPAACGVARGGARRRNCARATREGRCRGSAPARGRAVLIWGGSAQDPDGVGVLDAREGGFTLSVRRFRLESLAKGLGVAPVLWAWHPFAHDLRRRTAVSGPDQLTCRGFRFHPVCPALSASPSHLVPSKRRRYGREAGREPARTKEQRWGRASTAIAACDVGNPHDLARPWQPSGELHRAW